MFGFDFRKLLVVMILVMPSVVSISLEASEQKGTNMRTDTADSSFDDKVFIDKRSQELLKKEKENEDLRDEVILLGFEKQAALDETKKVKVKKTQGDCKLFTEQVISKVESKTAKALICDKEIALSSLTHYKTGIKVALPVIAALFLGYDHKYGQKWCVRLYNFCAGLFGVKVRNGIRRVVRPCLGIKEKAPVCKHKGAATLRNPGK